MHDRGRLVLKAQEIPYDDSDSNCLFDKYVFATSAAVVAFGPARILECYELLRIQATRCGGLDHLQVFEDQAGQDGPDLWFIECPDGVTAQLPSDY